MVQQAKGKGKRSRAAAPKGGLLAGPQIHLPIQDEAIRAVVLLARADDPDAAAARLQELQHEVSVESLLSARHVVIDCFIRQDRMESAFHYAVAAYDEGPGARTKLVPFGSLPTVLLPATQEQLLKALTLAQQYSLAVQFLRVLSSSGEQPPGDAVINSLMDAALRARSYEEGWEILEFLLLHQRRADKYFVSILTKSLELSDDKKWIRRGIALVDHFIEQQSQDVDEIVFNSLLNILGQMGDMPRLEQTLVRMYEYQVQPSPVTYGTIVKAYGRARDIDSVLKVWAEMRTHKLGVNPVTCGCVLDACVKCGHLDKAQAIFQEMRAHGLHKNTVLYATLIKGLAKEHDLPGALSLYQEMRNESVPCNLVTFNSLIDVCVRCGNLQMAALFLQDMMQLGIEPDLITFSTLIKGYSLTGEVHKAMALSDELKARGLKCDEIMYNSLLDGCAKAKKVDVGQGVFREMLRSEVAPSNVTFSILVKLYFQGGMLDEAFDLVETMPEKFNCIPNRVVYMVLLRCCCQLGNLALVRGAKLLAEVGAKRYSRLPDQGMLGTLISGCITHNDLGTAISIVRDFAMSNSRRYGNHLPVDEMRVLMQALGSSKREQGQALLEFLSQGLVAEDALMQLQADLLSGFRSDEAVLPAQMAPCSPMPQLESPAVQNMGPGFGTCASLPPLTPPPFCGQQGPVWPAAVPAFCNGMSLGMPAGVGHPMVPMAPPMTMGLDQYQTLRPQVAFDSMQMLPTFAAPPSPMPPPYNGQQFSMPMAPAPIEHSFGCAMTSPAEAHVPAQQTVLMLPQVQQMPPQPSPQGMASMTMLQMPHPVQMQPQPQMMLQSPVVQIGSPPPEPPVLPAGAAATLPPAPLQAPSFSHWLGAPGGQGSPSSEEEYDKENAVPAAAKMQAPFGERSTSNKVSKTKKSRKGQPAQDSRCGGA